MSEFWDKDSSLLIFQIVKKRFYTTLKGKVILISLAGIVTVMLIHLAIGYAFEQMNDNIDRLATPNEKMVLVNRLFRDVSQMNHLQREKAVLGIKDPSVVFIKESDTIYFIIDSLRVLFMDDSLQTKRISEISKLLSKREKLFIEYLNLLFSQSKNPDLSEVLDKLTHRLNSKKGSDRVIKYESTTTTKTISSDTIREERSGFFRRLFGKDLSSDETPGVIQKEIINEDVTIVVDTIDLDDKDAFLTVFESSLDSLRKTQMQQSDKLLQKELMLLNANSGIIHEIIDIINSVEQEELSRINQSTGFAFTTTRKTIKRLNFIVIVFVSVSAFLVLLIIIDIARSNKYRKQLELAHSEARKEAEAKQRFLSNMSHEIRTPLQSIYGYAEQARQNPDAKINLDAIFYSADHLLSIVNEVLDYSKFSSGKVVLDSAPFNPNAEISNVVAAMRPLAEKKGLELLFNKTGDDNVFVSGDAYRLKQIIYNVLGNAIKFTDSGRVSVDVAIIEVGDIVKLKFDVTDTGIGISKEHISLIFDEFGQSHSSNSAKYGGTGLGLTIVKKMIDMHKGQINVESEPGKGCCFSIIIPYRKAEVKEFQPVVNVAINRTNPNLVWFADDDPLILNLGEAVIKKQNISCKTFNCGEDLLSAFKNNKPDIIFLDMRMPGLSGLEVLKCIREQEQGQSPVKIIALTAQVLPSEQASVLSSGFDGLILKPFKEIDLLNVLGQKIDKEQADNCSIDTIVKMAGSKEEAVRIIQCIFDESCKDLKQIKKELWMNNREALSLLVHRMAGRVGQVNAMGYVRQLRHAERELHNGLKGQALKKTINDIINNGDKFLSMLTEQIN